MAPCRRRQPGWSDLRTAHIEEVDLSGCSLANIHTCGTRLERTHFEQEQLGEAIGEEISGEYGLARKGYLALERNFDELGDHTAARWAYQRRRRMEKRESLRGPTRPGHTGTGEWQATLW